VLRNVRLQVDLQWLRMMRRDMIIFVDDVVMATETIISNHSTHGCKFGQRTGDISAEQLAIPWHCQRIGTP
jgi:hypothetical protein